MEPAKGFEPRCNENRKFLKMSRRIVVPDFSIGVISPFHSSRSVAPPLRPALTRRPRRLLHFDFFTFDFFSFFNFFSFFDFFPFCILRLVCSVPSVKSRYASIQPCERQPVFPIFF